MHKNYNSALDLFPFDYIAMLFRDRSVSWQPLKLFEWNSIQF